MMRVFALSDLHIEYDSNARWVAGLSAADYRDDVLILAGDVAQTLPSLDRCLQTLAKHFRKLLFVPGNHDLWVLDEAPEKHSLQKLEQIKNIVASTGASMCPLHEGSVSIIPLLAWYDYSFGEPGEQLRTSWMDYRACRWPDGLREKEIAEYFAARNPPADTATREKVITFSHFVPRIDLMPDYIPQAMRYLYPVLGTTKLELQLRSLRSFMHIYGHTHVNRKVTINGVSYINNAFGYPSETRIAAKRMLCVYAC